MFRQYNIDTSMSVAALHIFVSVWTWCLYKFLCVSLPWRSHSPKVV